jgi:hypothetical protein
MRYKIQILYAIYIVLFTVFIQMHQFRGSYINQSSMETFNDSDLIIMDFVRKGDCKFNSPNYIYFSSDFLTFMKNQVQSMPYLHRKNVIIKDRNELRARFLAYFLIIKYDMKPKILLCSSDEK